jgi:hypothetical protein
MMIIIPRRLIKKMMEMSRRSSKNYLDLSIKEIRRNRM